MLVQDVYNLFILLELRGGVLLVLGALAEHVHGGDAALPVEVLDHLYRLPQFLARDIAAGNFLDYRSGNDLDRACYDFIYNAHVSYSTSAFVVGLDPSERRRS